MDDVMDEHAVPFQDFCICVGIALATRDFNIYWSILVILVVTTGKHMDSGALRPHALVFTAICLLVAFYIRFSSMPWDKWPLDEWHLKKQREKAIEPKREIIDPHHHLWDHRVDEKGW